MTIKKLARHATQFHHAHPEKTLDQSKSLCRHPFLNCRKLVYTLLDKRSGYFMHHKVLLLSVLSR